MESISGGLWPWGLEAMLSWKTNDCVFVRLVADLRLPTVPNFMSTICYDLELPATQLNLPIFCILQTNLHKAVFHRRLGPLNIALNPIMDVGMKNVNSFFNVYM